jgi:polysaccharide export outer membrane protein
MNRRVRKFLSGCATDKLFLGVAVVLAAPAPMHPQQTPSSAIQQVQQSLPQLQHPSATAGMHSGIGAPEAIAPEGMADLKLSAGSMVDVHVFEEPDIDGSYRLNSSGQITMPLAGNISLESLTLTEAEAAVSAKLVAGEILKTAHVVVNIDEYNAQNIVVLGEVNAPGRYPALTQRKLKDVLAMSGGQTALAGNEIVIHRSDQPAEVTETIHFDRGGKNQEILNAAINPGDTVLVKRAGVVYVLGAVNRPGGYLMQESGDLNIAEALALALGTAPQASIDKIRVVRKGPDGTLLEFSTMYDKVRKGEAVAMALHPEDIVFVPSSSMKSAFIHGSGILGAATSATIYVAH